MEKEGLRRWLKENWREKKIICPFKGIRLCTELCFIAFPELQKRQHKSGYACPCNNYTRSHVMKTARRYAK